MGKNKNISKKIIKNIKNLINKDKNFYNMRMDKSIWINASAGSGKTKQLVDRIIFLLLNGANSNEILCITFTKAAATEMKNRVIAKCLELADFDDERLKNYCDEINVNFKNPLVKQRIAGLFDEIVSNGIEIKTIHSFCEDIVKIYTKDYKLSRDFTILDDDQSVKVLQRAFREVISEDSDIRILGECINKFKILTKLAVYFSEDDMLDIFKSNSMQRKYFHDTAFDDVLVKKYMNYFGVDENSFKIIDIFKDFSDYELELNYVKKHKQAFEKLISIIKNDDRYVDQTRIITSIFNEKNSKYLPQDFFNIFLTASKSIRKRIFKVNNSYEFSELSEVLEVIQKALNFSMHIESLSISIALFLIMKEVFTKWTEIKSLSDLMDYDDIIFTAIDVLQNNALCDILYKINQKISHILVDEAQDTNFYQWSIINSIVNEFSDAGSLFVVGDIKQSIYSFQGVDVKFFNSEKAHVKSLCRKRNTQFIEKTSFKSYRTNQVILDLVNKVFNYDLLKKAILSDGMINHEAAFKRDGEVMLFPLVESVSEGNDDNPGMESIKILSKNIVNFIKSKLNTFIPSREKIATPKDFLILFQRRSDLMYQISYDLKREGIPVSGADRIEMVGEAVIQDIIALIKFITYRNDDMNLAILLKSPFFAVSEDELFDLCFDRGEANLFDVIKAKRQDIFDRLTHWVYLSETLTIYEFFYTILENEGYANLFKVRFGGMTDKILLKFYDILYEYYVKIGKTLDGFLFWISDRKIDIKKDPSDATFDEVQLMTVHGAKGLEAPFVILADANYYDPKSDQYFISEGLFLYNFKGKEGVHKDLYLEDLDTKKKEYYRLLYVAMTRARDGLYIFGAKSRINNELSWYNFIKTALIDIGAKEDDEGCFLFGGINNISDNNDKDSNEEVLTDIPLDFNLFPVSSGDLGYTPNNITNRSIEYQRNKYTVLGSILHEAINIYHDTKSLEYAWAHVDSAFYISDKENKSIKDTLNKIINNYPYMFQEDTYSELQIAVNFNGNVFDYRIDMLVPKDDEVMIIDFKSYSVPNITSSIKKQMHIYKCAVKKMFPGKLISCYILWTESNILEKITIN